MIPEIEGMSKRDETAFNCGIIHGGHSADNRFYFFVK